MNTQKLTSINLSSLAEEASDYIKKNCLVIAPFDTVYGIVCNPSEKAVNDVFDFKKRPRNKTIGLIAENIDEISRLASVSMEKQVFMKENALASTFILKLNPDSQEGISPNCIRNNTVAIRIASTDLLKKMCKLSGGLLAQTSANLSGSEEVKSVEELSNQFKDGDLNKIALIIDGGEIKSIGPSKIIDLTGDEAIHIERS